MLATPMDRPPAAHSGNTRGDTRMLFLFVRWRYKVAKPVNFPYDGNDANDGISLLEQGSVISVTSVIIIKGVLICI